MYIQIADLALALSFFKTDQFYLNNMADLHQLTSQSMTWRSYRDHRLLWRHLPWSI